MKKIMSFIAAFCIVMCMSITSFAAEYTLIKEAPAARQLPEYIVVSEDSPFNTNRYFVVNDILYIKDSSGNVLAKESNTGVAVYINTGETLKPLTKNGNPVYVTITTE